MRFYRRIVKPSLTDGGPDDITYVTPDGRCIPEDGTNRDWAELKAAIDGGDTNEIALDGEWPQESLPPPPAPPRPRPARNPDGTPTRP